MEFEFDEKKRLATVEKHSLDFLDTDILFGNQHLLGPARTVGGEQWRLAVGMIDDLHVMAILTGAEASSASSPCEGQDIMNESGIRRDFGG